MKADVRTCWIYKVFCINLIVIGNLKTSFIMAKTNIQFLDCADDMCIEVKSISYDDIIKIHMHDLYDLSGACIHLDKSTAIKFAKTLRTEINKIQ